MPSLIRRHSLKKRSAARRLRATRTALGSDPLLSTRAENARPSLTGQERSGPAGRLPLLPLLYFCSQTARQLVFCLFNFYFCCYVCLLLLVPVTVLRMRMRVTVYIRVKCLCPVSIKWSCEDGVIRVVSY